MAEGEMILRGRFRIVAVIAWVAIVAPAAVSQDEKPVKPFDQQAQVIVVTAEDFQFTPAQIHIKAGQNTQIQVISKDKTHGIRINPFPDRAPVSAAPGLEFLYGEDCWKLKKNVTVKIELIGHTPGTYIFSCCKSCGSGHKRMKGQLIVDP
jgi:heme/copper-type cytochrome/quinol oxidase subunit 2